MEFYKKKYLVFCFEQRDGVEVFSCFEILHDKMDFFYCYSDTCVCLISMALWADEVILVWVISYFQADRRNLFGTGG